MTNIPAHYRSAPDAVVVARDGSMCIALVPAKFGGGFYEPERACPWLYALAVLDDAGCPWVPSRGSLVPVSSLLQTEIFTELGWDDGPCPLLSVPALLPSSLCGSVRDAAAFLGLRLDLSGGLTDAHSVALKRASSLFCAASASCSSPIQ